MKTLEMKAHGQSGKLITFCGLDGSGKSSMIERLKSDLEAKGFSVMLTKQPTDMLRKNEIFRNFMDSADNSEYEYRALSLMAAADRVQHSNKHIMSALREGMTVICDRYFYSCLANLIARGYFDDEWIYEIARHIPRPDMAFFLDVPVETAIMRVRARKEERDRYIDVSLQYRLRKAYKEICEKNGGILLNSDVGLENTFEQIIKYVNKIYGGKNNG